MRLYTICVRGLPVVTMSTNTEPAMPDEFTTDADLMKAYRDARALREAFVDEELQRGIERRQIDEALEAWLGEDLTGLQHDGAPLWTGDYRDLEIREARVDEAARWHSSHQMALDSGEQDAGEEDWLVFLVSVKDPTECMP
jgi:hypothetical protein